MPLTKKMKILLKKTAGRLTAATTFWLNEDCDDIVEHHFREYQFLYNMKSGSRLLIFVLMGVAVARLQHYLKQAGILERANSSSVYRPINVNYGVLFNELTFMVVTLHLLRRQMFEARAYVYLPILCTFFMCTNLSSTPILGISCSRMFDVFSGMPVHPADNEAFLLARNFDCESQSFTTLWIHMALIQLSPHLWPSPKMVHLNIVFLIVGFFIMTRIQPTLYLSNLDIAWDWTLLIITQATAVWEAACLDANRRTKYWSDRDSAAASQKVFRMLELMLPEHLVMPMLVSPDTPIALHVDRATILFVLISDFDKHAQRCTPTQLLAFLNSTFVTWDDICENHDVTKIETVGEEYVAAVGVSPADVATDKRIGHKTLLERLTRVAAELLNLQTDELNLKMGMHTGPVIAGVISQKLPRFRLFGDTINTAARMMQKGVVGKLQFGEATHAELPDSVVAVPRGEVEMKGKGHVKTFFLEKGYKKSYAPVGLKDVKNSNRQKRSTGGSFSRLSHVKPTIQEIVHWDDAGTHSFHNERNTSRSYFGGKPFGEVELAGRGTHASGLASNASTYMQEYGLPLVHEDFEGLLKKLAKEDVAKKSMWQKIFWCTLRSNFFDADMEGKFREWHYEEVYRRTLRQRLVRFLLTIATVTVMETCLWFWVGDMGKAPHVLRDYGYKPHFRLPIYLTCRALALAIVATLARKASNPEWCPHSRGTVELLMVMSSWAISMLVLTSYDAASRVQMDESVFYPGMDHTTLEALLQSSKWSRGSSVNSVVFALFFYVIVSWDDHLFVHSLLFLVLAAVLLYATSSRIWYTPLADHYEKWHPDGDYPFNNCSLYYSTTLRKLGFPCIAGLKAVHANFYERALRSRFKALRICSRAEGRIGHILETLMPPLVLEQIRAAPLHVAPPSHQYKHATIAQSDLVGFTNLASSRSPLEVVQFISELFGVFDELTDELEVYKVETVGDAYIAGQAEFPLTKNNSPLTVVKFALAMVSATQAWAAKSGLDVNTRVGVHSGACVGGIVGGSMQRYHLFGEFMTVLETLESTSASGRVQLSSVCHQAVLCEMENEGLGNGAFSFTRREEPQLKTSKGELHDYDEVGGPTYLVDVK